MAELRNCKCCGAKAERITDYAKYGKNTEMVRCSNTSCDEWTVVGSRTRQEADESWNDLHSNRKKELLSTIQGQLSFYLRSDVDSRPSEDVVRDIVGLINNVINNSSDNG